MRFRKLTWPLRAYCKKEEESCLSKYWWNILVNRWEKLLDSKRNNTVFFTHYSLFLLIHLYPWIEISSWINRSAISNFDKDCQSKSLIQIYRITWIWKILELLRTAWIIWIRQKASPRSEKLSFGRNLLFLWAMLYIYQNKLYFLPEVTFYQRAIQFNHAICFSELAICRTSLLSHLSKNFLIWV